MSALEQAEMIKKIWANPYGSGSVPEAAQVKIVITNYDPNAR